MRSALVLALVAALPALADDAPAPSVPVTGTFACAALGRAPVDVGLNVYRLPGREPVSRTSWASGRFSLTLPPGKYLLQFHGVEIAQLAFPILITKDAKDFDLGAIDLEPSVLAAHYGKPPPAWHVAEARGVDPKAALADFKGKWTLLVFWGFW